MAEQADRSASTPGPEDGADVVTDRAGAASVASADMIAKWRDEGLCVRCERPLTSSGPCQPKNLPSRPTHRSVADLMGLYDDFEGNDHG